jgi:predicted dehydrogenase
MTSNDENILKRRDFIQAGAAGLAASALVHNPPVFGEQKSRRIGVIGSGWFGKGNMIRFIQMDPSCEIVSLCDVDSKMLSSAAALTAARQANKKTPRTYADYREMLKEKDLDVVIIATPDHWHALPAIAALKSGADLYLEKPTGVDVVESQSILAAARKYKKVVQVNLQRRSTPHIIEARDRIIKEGKLGKIGLVETYCYFGMRVRGAQKTIEPPENLDWNTWCGPAPMIPYNKRIHPRRWRSYMEYCNGILGDMCVHMYDMVRWMLELGWPSRIASTGGILIDKESPATCPDTQTATFDHDDLRITWQHRTWGNSADPKYPWGATFYGDKGTLKVSVSSYDFIPRGRGTPEHGDAVIEMDKYPDDKKEPGIIPNVVPAMRHHVVDFLAALEKRSEPVADIQEGHISSSSCIMANVAMKLGRTFEWDSKKERVAGDDEANKMLARPYRKPWVHPEPNKV